MNSRFLISFFLLMLASPLIYAQAYKGVVEKFYGALGKRDFDSAYALCTGPQWGTLQQFADSGSYGGINHVILSSVTYKRQRDTKNMEAEVDVVVKDPVNGDGRYIQNFVLVEKEHKWFIRSTSLLQTDRAEKGWNLKLIDQPGLDKATVNNFIKPVYDTVKTDAAVNKKSAQRIVNDPRFFQTPGGVYAVVVVENPGREQGILSYGWCDVFVFEQKDQQWQMTDFKLHAGGGGMYGNSGGFKKLLQAGTNVVALVIAGGQMHMGDLVEQDDIIAMEAGKLYNLTSVVVHHSYGDFGSSHDEKSLKICNERNYLFIKSEKKNYDLKIIRSSCLVSKKEKKTDSVIIPWIDRNYSFPEALMHEPEAN